MYSCFYKIVYKKCERRGKGECFLSINNILSVWNNYSCSYVVCKRQNV